MSILGLLNRLLPFATPGTPVVQDVIHLATICAILYFAPQIQEWFCHRRLATELIEDLPAPNDTLNDPLGNEDGPDAADPDVNEGAFAEPVDDHVNDEHQPIPAIGVNPPVAEGEAGPARVPEQRNVGAKKAKSLARRDQRRAYHEFMRSQGDAQRARDAEGAAEREAALSVEKERRRKAEEALEVEKAKERKARREREEHERAEEIWRRDLAITIVKDELGAKKMCDLFKVAKQIGGDVDEEWVEKILSASGLLGRKGDVMTMITGMGWVVRVTSDDMAKLYRTATETELGDESGRIEYHALGTMLETTLRGQVDAV